MKKALIINAHQEYPFAKGELNREIAKRIANYLKSIAYEIKTTTMKDEWNADEEVDKHTWADVVVLQSPTNWMGFPWIFKKYMDEVYTAGMFGKMSQNDGRIAEAPKKNYGAGGLMQDTKYMLSLTFNAPEESFNDPSEFLFAGKSVDDLYFAQHMNFKFFGMQPLPTFACFDVMKNPNIENDFKRLEAHLKTNFTE
ncbi:Flavodoxin-like fold domain protein [Croceitalea dokdonensis DOKDO 023]|uniref:Flavodoxin-like fold domain protein n=1 Tax=Croceitalea dokdonensis DOKDO 023 TaxID=1300341 RepID=A0A0P7B2D0_9FLAO|nr:NAD(P)H-dependent oxidoreductase [Croceitalea dokdonensis]KPM33538.1 Flavodoxin-like fold domain protein [Croceitalea dokdonensis DOKDO 023]